MALTVETGTAIQGAESYASVAGTDAYFTARGHLTNSTTWAAASTGDKEGALREATAYLDSTYGPAYKGSRKGYVQGLLWPRTNALDEAGYPLPDLPAELVNATCELAARALSSPLAADAARGGRVKRNKVDGAVEQEFFDGAPTDTRYGVVEGLIWQLLNGTQNGGTNWVWL